jgi:hypothetical protein
MLGRLKGSAAFKTTVMPIPVIVAAEQVDEKSLQIKWKLNNFDDDDSLSSFSRYRVYYREKGTQFYNEWPGKKTIMSIFKEEKLI